MSSTTSLGEEIYTGTASFGRVWTVIQAVLGTIVPVPELKVKNPLDEM